MWGFASSPLVVGELVVVFAGGPIGKSVVACDRSSGELIWASGDGTHSYSSAHMARFGAKDQVLMWSEVGLQSYDPENGQLLWQHETQGHGHMSIVQPLVVADSVILGAGYGPGSRRLDVRWRDGSWSVREVWTSRRFKPYFNDFVHYDRHCYGFHGRIFCCIDAETGDSRWKGGRYGNGQVLLVADMSLLLVLSETGEVVLLEATPRRRIEVGRFQAIQGKTWNHPVIAHGKLFVRNGEEAACFDLPAH
jgi:outer membrane protein assembly factor BamB